MTFCTWLLLVLTVGYVGLASILGVFMCGVYFWLFDAPVPYIGFCIFGFIYVTYRHKSNIQRMLKGEEPKLGEKPKDAPVLTSEQTVSGPKEETK